MAGYIRQDVGNNIENGEIIDAVYLDQEFDALATAFNSGTGHKHDGSSGEGAPITVIGPAQDVITSSSLVRPKTTNTYDLGSATFKWKDAHFDGVVNSDDFTATATNGFKGKVDDTALAPSYTWTGDLNTGIYHNNTADFIGFTTGGTSRLSIDSSGVVAVVGNATVGGTLAVTGAVTGGSFAGDIAATNITSGTLPSARISGSYTGLTGTGALTVGSIASGFGNINVGGSTITGGTITGTSLVSSGNVTSASAFISSTASVILAGSGSGNIFLRPAGSGSTTNQTSISNGGNMVVDGSVTADSFTGSLDATNLAGTVASARLSGAYTGVTGLGTLTSLTVDNLLIDNNQLYSTVGTGSVFINGGTTVSPGANVQLYAALHPSFPNEAYYDAVTHTFRSASAAITFATLGVTNLALGSNISISFSGTGAATTRTNLGLGTLATQDEGTGGGDFRDNTANDARFMIASNNLSQLTNLTTARANLGLGSASTVDQGTATNEIRTNSQNDARFHISGTSTLDAGDLPDTTAGTTWVRERTAGAAVGAIGTYALLTHSGGGAVSPGDTKSANLNYASTVGAGATAATGTWRAMGELGGNGTTVWLRVS